MKFFIPAAKNEQQEEQVYNSVKRFLGEQLGAQFSNRKIASLRYRHDGNTYHAEVGEIHGLNNEPVIAILFEPLRNLYHVCTTSRGVIRGMSILVGHHDVVSVADFDN